MARLEQLRPGADDALAADIDAILSRRANLERLLVESPIPAPGLVKTRRHGDYRLGQILVAKGDVFVVDLEGEARRPLAERRAKALPLTDVAGMLRSFDQAAWAALFRFAETDPAALDQLLAPALVWRDLAAAAFLGEYRSTIGDCPSWPGDDVAGGLLRIIMIECIFQELLRDLAHRPNWARVSLRGLLDLLEPRTAAENTYTET
jgi:maltose alpha-D-glucosyltransferase/alpha-amylase